MADREPLSLSDAARIVNVLALQTEYQCRTMATVLGRTLEELAAAVAAGLAKDDLGREMFGLLAMDLLMAQVPPGSYTELILALRGRRMKEGKEPGGGADPDGPLHGPNGEGPPPNGNGR